MEQMQLDAEFVDDYRNELIQRVTAVMPIADSLLSTKIIHEETYSNIHVASTTMHKMRVLLNALNTSETKSAFYKLLEVNESFLVKDLEEGAKFVDTHYKGLTQRDMSVMPIADKLHGSKRLTWEEYRKIKKATSEKSQIRELLNSVKSGGRGLKSSFCEALKEIMPDLIQELKGSSSQTDDEKQVTESHPQRAEAGKEQAETHRSENDIRWNPSSIKHRSEIEELKSDSRREKVGNLYFSKSKKYIIGSGGSGTVYLGLKEDGTEVAIKRICKDQQKIKNFENELKHLRDLNLESKNIVRYVDQVEDEDFYYLALQLCEYDMENYMENLRQEEQKDKDTALRKIVKEILLGLQVLHCHEVIHRDIKPGNVLIDSGKNARLADFGLSRKLEEGRSTVHTARAGTQGWEATEILNQETDYRKSSDIQVSGMLVYYILSDGKHPFGDMKNREENIKKGQHSLEDLQDIVAKDLIVWMINKDQDKRPTVDKVLDHPYFWNDKRMREVLHNLGNKEEVQEYKNYENNKKLFETVQKYTEGKTFSDWRTNAPKTWTKIGKNLPNDLLGLLRHLRNALGHQEKEFYKEKMIDKFPDFLISLHSLALEMGWEF